MKEDSDLEKRRFLFTFLANLRSSTKSCSPWANSNIAYRKRAYFIHTAYIRPANDFGPFEEVKRGKTNERAVLFLLFSFIF